MKKRHFSRQRIYRIISEKTKSTSE